MLLCVPLIADGFLQLLTSYESTNFKRVLTGVPFGFGLGILFPFPLILIRKWPVFYLAMIYFAIEIARA